MLKLWKSRQPSVTAGKIAVAFFSTGCEENGGKSGKPGFFTAVLENRLLKRENSVDKLMELRAFFLYKERTKEIPTKIERCSIFTEKKNTEYRKNPTQLDFD